MSGQEAFLALPKPPAPAPSAPAPAPPAPTVAPVGKFQQGGAFAVQNYIFLRGGGGAHVDHTILNFSRGAVDPWIYLRRSPPPPRGKHNTGSENHSHINEGKEATERYQAP